SVRVAGQCGGVLGVLLGVAAVQALGGKRFAFAMDVLGFCEEEGVRFRTPYLGSRVVCGCFDPALLDRTDAAGVSLAAALRSFGLGHARMPVDDYPGRTELGLLATPIGQVADIA